MKPIIIILSLFIWMATYATDTTHVYPVPDSIHAQIFLTSFRVNSFGSHKEMQAGIKTNIAALYFKESKNNKQIIFEFPATAAVIATGLKVAVKKGEAAFKCDWKAAEDYLLGITVAPDSAGNFLSCSGIVLFPKENKQKLIGTCKIEGSWLPISEPATFCKSSKNENVSVRYDNAWILGDDNVWTSLQGDKVMPPTIKIFSNTDSLGQRAIDIGIIEDALAKGKINTKNKTPESLYYNIVKQGTGRKITLDNSVVVYYHLMTIRDTTTIDEAKDTPVTFPLKRLIPAWQIGLTLCNVGSKIRLVSPSCLSYSTRTTISVIPPNSILVFDIEVVDAKKPD